MIFMQGMAGIMFKQLSWVIGFSLLCSLGVAMTLVPMLSSKFLRLNGNNNHADTTVRPKAASSWGDHYQAFLHLALKHRPTVLFLAVILLGGSILLVPLVGVEFMPESDEAEVRIDAEMEVGTRVEILDEQFKRIEELVDQYVPEKESSVAYLGGSSWRPSGTHTGQLRIALKPQSERTRSSAQIAAALRPKLVGLPGVTARTRPGPGPQNHAPGFQRRGPDPTGIRGHDLAVSAALTEEVKKVMESVPGVTDVRTSVDAGTPEDTLYIDRLRAADMKLTVSQVADTIQTALAGSTAGYYREGGKEIPIVLKLNDSEKMDLSEILDLTLTNADGTQIVLANVVKVRHGRGPVRIQRQDQERVNTLSAEAGGRDLGSVLADIREKLHQVPVPPDFGILFSGDYEEQQKSFRELLLALGLALLFVYMVMACQFESLRHPLVVMFSVPFAAIGVILALFSDQNDLQCPVLYRLHHAGRYSGQQCHPAGGPRQPAPASRRHAFARGRGRIRPEAAPAHPHDRDDHHPGPDPPGPGHRRSRRNPGTHGPGRDRRPAELDPDHPGAGADHLHPVRIQVQTGGG